MSAYGCSIFRSSTHSLLELEVHVGVVLDANRPGIGLPGDVQEDAGALDMCFHSHQVRLATPARIPLQSHIGTANIRDVERSRPIERELLSHPTFRDSPLQTGVIQRHGELWWRSAL